MSQASTHLPIEETELFRKYVDLSDDVWDVVVGWSSLAQTTVGRQLVRAVDSIGANLAEGDGRYGSADSIHFFVTTRASARESRYWLKRAAKRNLISAKQAEDFEESLDHATRSLNSLITYRREKQGIRESISPYEPNLESLPPNTS